MAILHLAPASQNGPRPIKWHRDSTQIVALLAAAFDLPPQRAKTYYEILPEVGYQSLRQWWQGKKSHPTGFVWEQDGRLIGNVSFLPTTQEGSFLIANVAVHPDFRRRGVAYGLMDATIAHARQAGERLLFLQVDEKNSGAVRLYEQLGFQHLQGVTAWRTAEDHALPRLAQPPFRRNFDEYEGFRLQPLAGEQWREAYALDVLVQPRALSVPYFLEPEMYRPTWGNWWRRFMAAVSYEHWTAVADNGQLVGLGQIKVEWGRPYLLKLRVHPTWQTAVTRPLLAKLLRRLTHLGRHAVHLPHPSHDHDTAVLLREASFTPQQTLLHMQLEL